MEHLSKQQVTLLCLLVALFTSIATSVITASLMDESAGGVSQTIYKVVERTLAEVAPKDSPVRKNVEEHTPVEPPKKEELPLDQIVEKARVGLVTIWTKEKEEKGRYVSAGAILGNKNAVAVFNSQNLSRNGTYIIELSDGSQVEMVRESTAALTEGLALLTYSPLNTNPRKLTGLALGTLATEKLASNVIALGSKEQSNVVSTGIIAEFPFGTATTTDKRYAVTDINLSSKTSGWLLLNTSGSVIGIISAGAPTDKGARYADIQRVIAGAIQFF